MTEHQQSEFEDETSARKVRSMAEHLLDLAQSCGLNVTITLRPLQPPRMGHTEAVVEVWKKRNKP